MKAVRSRRRYRLFLPLTVVIVVILSTIVVRWLSEPDYTEKHYLSPSTAGVTSGQELADLLRAKGIQIQRHTRSSDALAAVWGMRGTVTLFVPAPEFMHPDYLWMLRNSPGGTRVVLVEPGTRQLTDALPPLGVAERRWATAVASPGPGCTLSDARRVGTTRTRYGLWSDALVSAEYCYEQGLAALSFQGVEFVVAGSPEPFRSDRIGENDNADFAVDLLSVKPTLVWLDLHAPEPKPKSAGEDIGAGKPIPSLGPGDERVRGGSPQPRPSVSRRPPDIAAPEPESPFPPWLFPLSVMLLLTALAFAVARGRRLGGPVTEPLPIEVKGAETAIGRGNLYRRAKARGQALETLRFEARRRIGVALGLPPKAERDQILDALAARLGEDRALLENILYGPEPETDPELEERTRELLLLVEQTTRGKKENPRD
ncbi:hypothetical protein Rhe02_51280 [Rhizocola hellebori]|uniref:DUF4350 domain-containing protein n=1 Tax=Rhizocola hellebori TaxID=1392758 RepID=A0A8J3VIH4_9ACTN|nr:DUF4350 domain-containing protein [Rhizocola hellebori]GIH07061.1 hypothetical protein Rhe02_51280 [Rhizocola hellebori]